MQRLSLVETVGEYRLNKKLLQCTCKQATSFPGSLFFSSLGHWNKDPGRGWSRDHL